METGVTSEKMPALTAKKTVKTKAQGFFSVRVFNGHIDKEGGAAGRKAGEILVHTRYFKPGAQCDWVGY